MTQQEFLDHYNTYKDIELSEEEQEKLHVHSDELYTGAKVKIHWQNMGGKQLCVDNGLLLLLPFQNEINEDFFVHIPKPENPGGRDDVDPEWAHINALLKSVLVTKIVVK